MDTNDSNPETTMTTTTRSAECFCRDLFNQGHGSECGLIEAARDAALTAAAVQAMAREIADELGHAVKVTASQAPSSEKLGRQIRVRVACENKKRTWFITRAIGWELGQRIAGRVFAGRRSHVETRIGNVGGCAGFVTGSAAAFRVYPEARA